MTLQKNLANVMKAIQTSRKLSIADFSEELGISRSSLQKLLNGNGNPRMDTVEHIAKRLKTNPTTLLSCSFTEEQWKASLLLLQPLDVVSKMPSEKRYMAAFLLHELILLLEPET